MLCQPDFRDNSELIRINSELCFRIWPRPRWRIAQTGRNAGTPASASASSPRHLVRRLSSISKDVCLVSGWFLSMMQHIFHASRRTPHRRFAFRASKVCLVGENPDEVRPATVKIQGSMAIRLTAMHGKAISTTPPPPRTFPRSYVR